MTEPIPEGEIAAVQRLMQHQKDYKSWPYHVQVGSMVTVIQGLHGAALSGEAQVASSFWPSI